MRSHLFRTIFVICLSLFTVTSSYAYWQCRMHNFKAQNFVGNGATRALASANVARFCVASSNRAANCVSDGCSQIGGSVPVAPVGFFHCTIQNGRGEVMTASGATRALAAANASAMCSRNSTYASTCRIVRCWQ